MRRIVLLPAFEPDAWLQLAASERASNAFVVPTMLARIITQMDAASAPDLGPLQAIAYGGGRMPPELLERALTLFPNTGFRSEEPPSELQSLLPNSYAVFSLQKNITYT